MTNLKSMTAFGRGEVTSKSGRLICEIQSLNRRYLDCQIGLPGPLSSFEVHIRRFLAQRIGRGQISCQIRLEMESSQVVELVPNLSFAKGVQSSWKQLASALNLSAEMPVSYLLAFQESLVHSPLTHVNESLMLQAVEQAIIALQRMKGEEGAMLGTDILHQIALLETNVGIVETRAPHVVQVYRDKLMERLRELGQGSEDNERILREIALFAEKIDISEELVRLKSHLAQMRQWLTQPLTDEKQCKGKLGEFLVQELSRETNTIGAKGNDLLITQTTLEMKGVIEKLREQMQNVE